MSGAPRASARTSGRLFDRIYGGIPRFAAEAPWSRRLALRLVRAVPAGRETVLFGAVPTVGDAAGESAILFVCADPEALVAPAAQGRLIEALERSAQFDLLFPVSNESASPELRRPPGFAYASVSELERYAEEVAAKGDEPLPIAAVDFPVFAVRRAALARVSPTTPLADVPAALAAAGGRLAVDPASYVHRYGEMDASARADLVGKLPPGARRVLDVGCSQGATAAALRAAGVVEIVGIEPDAGDAARARTVYDRVVEAAVEDVREPWEGRFDAILFGDVLEHLEDPSEALVRVRPWLSPAGRVIASVPNVANWAVIGGLLEGRFDYVPYATLSGTHLRFFTRTTAVDLFEACGYAVESVEGVPGVPGAEGRALIAKLRSIPGAAADLAVLEWIVVARSVPGSL